MKKTLRKIFTCLSATVTLLTASVSAMPASAILYLTHYDINNKSYISRINKMERYIELEEEFVETAAYLTYPNYADLKHIYFQSRSHTTISCYLEYESAETGGRYFNEGCMYFNIAFYTKYRGDDTVFFETYSLDEVNKTLRENELKVQLSENIRSNGTKEIKPTYDEDITEKELIRAAIEMNRLYDIKFFHCILVSTPTVYYDESEQTSTEETTPSTTLGTPTIAGDLDLNEAVGTTDIVMLSKYVASAQIYPIEDATALANADVNQDGSINSDDTAVMIEMYLGAYEMI